MTQVRAPEKIDAEAVDGQTSDAFQFLSSLLRRSGGWNANHAVNGGIALML